MIHEFRCWDNLTQKYTANHHIMISLDGNVINLQNGAGSPELEIEQYTGKQDKHGKKIFAGDTIKWPAKVSGVWSDQAEKEIVVEFPFICGNTNKGEITGTIHDKKEK